jgi:hypothetical protein
MGRYISVGYHFEREVSLARLLAPIFASLFFTPIAAGGFQVAQQGDRWFLGGYALEDFVSLFIRRGTQKALSIERASTKNDTEQHYLTSITDIIVRSKDISTRLSPFETNLPDIGVTSIRSVSLDATILDNLDQWLESFPRGEIYLYGAVRLAVQSGDKLDWARVFRYFFSYGGNLVCAPFLFLRVAISPFEANQFDLMLHTTSHVWLESAKALDGRIGQQEANINLEQLAEFAQIIAQSEIDSLKSTELDIGEGMFYQERERIQTAFSNLPRLIYSNPN